MCVFTLYKNAHRAHIPIQAHSVLFFKSVRLLIPERQNHWLEEKPLVAGPFCEVGLGLGMEIVMLTDLLIGRAAMRPRAIDLHRSAEMACQVESIWRKVQRVFVRDY
jgi:hypothetical protein